ncbi:hypothetical protein [Roseibacillus persicicus]|uniref:Uncharacterized protein n=1 Tax=Roseibacillus persicicus TaxID=454148 RepID=A0A918TRN4_9BACT|nr:hypothetical protein [Roseibacillus persicicus]MDQ8189589.1 hypothetical protein [Roseibacillus persicicus]GHC59553.1 hypothetical protein GCM10007100_28440 [Roseibacillus persicicus]
MKKLIAAFFAIASGLYLLTIGLVPAPTPLDPLPFIDEGVVFLILINSLAALGLDLRRFVGMKGGKKKSSEKPIDIN